MLCAPALFSGMASEGLCGEPFLFGDPSSRAISCRSFSACATYAKRWLWSSPCARDVRVPRSDLLGHPLHRLIARCTGSSCGGRHSVLSELAALMGSTHLTNERIRALPRAHAVVL